MPKEEWGVKRTCAGCGARFYDLNQSPISCPKCASAFVPEVLLKSRRGPPEPVKVRKPKPVPELSVEEVIKDIPEAKDDDNDGAAAALLDNDADSQEDVAAVVETRAGDKT